MRAYLLLLGGLGLGLLALAQPGSLPDLVVEQILLDPAEPEPGAEVRLIATIANRGRGEVLEGFSVFFEVDGELVGSRRVFSLRAGRKVEVSTPWRAVEGEHRLRVRVDPFREVDESNEFNNSLEVSIEVHPLQGILSITLGLLEGSAQGLEGAGQAIQVPPGEDLFQLFETFKKASTTAGEEFSKGSGKISSLTKGLPSPLAAEAQILTAEQIAQLYESLASAFAQVTDGLQRLNLQLLPAAFEEIQSDLAELATLSIAGIALTDLGETVTLMDQVIQKTGELQAAASGSAQVDVNSAVQDLLGVLAQIGERWVLVGEEVVQSGASKAARFTDGKGQPVNRYRVGEELRISLPRAERFRLEVFDGVGRAVFARETKGNQLIWKGTNDRGQPLPAGRYFFKITVLEPSNERWVELGRIILEADGG